MNMEYCSSSYANFVAGMFTSALLMAVWQEMKNHKEELQRTRNQWKAFSVSPARGNPDIIENNILPPAPQNPVVIQNKSVGRHPDVMDNNSIPGGP